MKTWSASLALALLTACGVTRNQVIGSYPDGSIAQEIDCRQDHPEKCQQRAQQLCRPFGREPQLLQPLSYNNMRDRWTMVVTCGPTYAGAPPPLAAAAPAGSMVPLPPPPSRGSNMPQ
jgi:hypothetical protein